MKLGPIEIRWPIRAAAAPEPVQEPKRALGASGTVNLRGYLTQEEYLSDLKGQKGIETYDRMVRSDAAVQEALGHIIYPILNGNFEIEPAGDDPEDREVAEFVRCALFDWMEQPWHEHVREALSFLQYGHSVFEHDWKVISAQLDYEDPDADDEASKQINVPERQWLTFKRMGIRLPRTIYKWHSEDGELTGITQRVWRDNTYVTADIDAENLVVFTHNRVGDDYTGTSLLRGAYQAWFMKQACQNVLGLAIQAHGIGINTLYLPSYAREDAELEAKCEQILTDLRAGDSVYAIWPFPKANGQNDGGLFEITTPQSGGENIGGIVNALEYFRGEIKGTVLARFSELGHGSTGARATGETQSQIWYDSLSAISRQLCETYATPIKRLVDANYANVSAYPKLVCRDIEATDIAAYAQAISQLTAAGAVIPDRPIRNWIRSLYGAPVEDEADPMIAQVLDPNLGPPVKQQQDMQGQSSDADGPQHNP